MIQINFTTCSYFMQMMFPFPVFYTYWKEIKTMQFLPNYPTLPNTNVQNHKSSF